MGTRVFLIRHGATVLTAEDRFAGATDVELSDEGREQARRLAERLSTEMVAAVYLLSVRPNDGDGPHHCTAAWLGGR